MSELLRRASWWIRDYLFAGWWQLRAIVGHADPTAWRRGTGTPVLLIPGIYETWRFMQPLAEQIVAHGHPVHVISQLRRNSRPLATGAQHVEAYIEQHGLSDVVIVAHSKGGLIGKQVMGGRLGDRIRGMVAVSTPFGGSSYARMMLLPSLRQFAPRHASIVALGRHLTANGRVVSIYAAFDPHIPESSELVGATNIELDTAGHFRILADPRVLDEVWRMTD